jgi:hypothetical protein
MDKPPKISAFWLEYARSSPLATLPAEQPPETPQEPRTGVECIPMVTWLAMSEFDRQRAYQGFYGRRLPPEGGRRRKKSQ